MADLGVQRSVGTIALKPIEIDTQRRDIFDQQKEDIFVPTTDTGFYGVGGTRGHY